MTYLEQYRTKKGETINRARMIGPLQTYTMHQRVIQLNRLLDKMEPKEREKFKGIFTHLKTWNADWKASVARDALLNHVQHCTLLGKSTSECSKHQLGVLTCF